MKMDNPTTITVVGSIIAALVLAIFGLLAGNIQKKQSDADKAELLSANKALSDSVNQKNEELAQKSDDHSRNLEVYARKLETYSNRLEQYATEQKLKDKEVIDLQKQLLEGAIAQKQKTEEINKLNLQVIEAQKELSIAQRKSIEFSSESLKYLTGGDSWCYITISPNAGSKPNLNLHHVGNYPLAALRIRITHNSAISRKANKDAPGNGPYYKGLVMSGTYTTVLPVGPLPKGFVEYNFGSIPFEPNIGESYYIQFYAQNGTWYQQYAITYDTNNQPVTTYKVFRDANVLMSYPQ